MQRTMISLLALLLAGPATSQDLTQAGRFTFAPVEDGALRLDTVTGAVSLCAGSGGAYSCTPVAEGGADASGGTLPADLAARVAALETRLASLEESSILLGDTEAMERVGVLADRMMTRFFDMVGEMRRDFENETY